MLHHGATYYKSAEIHEINSKLDSYTQNLNSKIDALPEEISAIKEKKENKAYAIFLLEEIVNDLKKEKQELNRENDELREKIRNLMQNLSDVRTKVVDLQEEKSSLITALKLTYRDQIASAESQKIEDLESENNNLWTVAKKFQEDLDKSKRRDLEFTTVLKRGGNSSKTPEAVISFETRNQYEILGDGDCEEDINGSVPEPDMPTTQPVAIQHNDREGVTHPISNGGKTGTISSASQHKETAGGAAPKDDKSKPNIVLTGGSMI